MIDLKKMETEWRRKGFKNKEIAEMIGMLPNSLSKKLRGEVDQEISATQAFIICDLLGSPLDIFIVKEKTDGRNA